MTDLAQFLLDRIAEDKAAAQEAAVDWNEQDWEEIDLGTKAHTFQHAPARVLAECEAKRLLVERHDEVWRQSIRDMSPMNAYIAKGRLGGLWEGLKHLALPYADHPDYRQEWKP